MKAEVVRMSAVGCPSYAVGVRITVEGGGIIVMPTDYDSGLAARYSDVLGPRETVEKVGEIECPPELEDAVRAAVEAQKLILANSENAWREASALNNRLRHTD